MILRTAIVSARSNQRYRQASTLLCVINHAVGAGYATRVGHIRPTTQWQRTRVRGVLPPSESLLLDAHMRRTVAVPALEWHATSLSRLPVCIWSRAYACKQAECRTW